MKRVILLFIFGLILSFTSGAQNIQFTPLAGYTFADKFSFYRGTARIGDGFTYGAALSYGIRKNMALELNFSRQECDVEAYSDYHGIDVKGKISANYILLGVSKLYPTSRQMMLFTGTGIGVGIYSAQTSQVESGTHLAAGLNGGMKYLFTEKFGIRLQANLFIPLTDISAGLWWGSSGSSVGLSSWVPFVQFGFQGGLIFNIN